MIPAGTLDDLNLVAVHRVQAMTQRAADYTLVLLAAHLMTGEAIGRATFLRLCDEAEAVMGRGERRLCGPCERGQKHLCEDNEYLHCDNVPEVTR